MDTPDSPRGRTNDDAEHLIITLAVRVLIARIADKVRGISCPSGVERGDEGEEE